MKKIKVLSIVGTRPELIRLSRVFAKLDKYTDHILLHTGQNYDYELNQVFFDELEIKKPNYFLDAAKNTSSPMQTIANIISGVDKILIDEAPDAILVLGDTNSCLSVISAKRRKIPIFHMEAGNRCFDLRVPEEINRKIIDHTSDINMTYSNIARQYLIKEGINADTIIKTGSPLFEVVDYFKEKIDSACILETLDLQKDEFFLISFHREENIDSDINFLKFIEILNFLAKNYNKKVIVSTHPRTKKRINSLKVEINPLVNFLSPFGYFDYMKLQLSSFIVLSDSGTITEESSMLNFPAINLRETHERPEGMEEASVIMSGLSFEIISQAIEVLKNQKTQKNRIVNIPDDYKVNNVSEKVLRIILSYTDFVNRVIWKKID